MKILVVGSGGREHALAWKLSMDERVERVYVAPGNAGTALEPKLENLPLTDIAQLAGFARAENIAFTVVGPEAPLAAGIVDVFRQEGLKIFGPTKAAAMLESSKDFAKAFMMRHGVPTAAYATFTDATAAHAYVREKGAPIVIKADGLAAGKGVVVAMAEDEAHEAIDAMLSGEFLGKAGSRVVIEEYLEGEEASFIVMVDGEHVLPMATSQDHKRLLDADKGPNTGGMGAYSPAPVVTDEVYRKALGEIILPTVRGMAQEGTPFTGFLYAGLMIGRDASGALSVKTLEFNCRMGDPETQPIMMRLKTPLAELVDAAIEGRLDAVSAEWDDRFALGVVAASEGYPVSPKKGDAIVSLPENTPLVHVFHAGTRAENDGIVTAGGRVLAVVALGETLAQAQKAAYEAVDKVKFRGLQFRRDIGHRAL